MYYSIPVIAEVSMGAIETFAWYPGAALDLRTNQEGVVNRPIILGGNRPEIAQLVYSHGFRLMNSASYIWRFWFCVIDHGAIALRNPCKSLPSTPLEMDSIAEEERATDPAGATFPC